MKAGESETGSQKHTCAHADLHMPRRCKTVDSIVANLVKELGKGCIKGYMRASQLEWSSLPGRVQV